MTEPSLSEMPRTPLLESLKQLFAERRWGFSELEGRPALASELAGPHGSWTLCAHAIDDPGLVVLASIHPERVPGDRRAAMSELVTRANYGLSLGTLEMDYDDGELRCSSVLVVDDGVLRPRAVERLIRANGRTLEAFLPAISAILAGEAPADALAALTSA